MVRRLLLLVGCPVESPTLWGWEPVPGEIILSPKHTPIPAKAPSQSNLPSFVRKLTYAHRVGGDVKGQGGSRVLQSCEHIHVSSLVSRFASQSAGHFQVLILFLRTSQQGWRAQRCKAFQVQHPERAGRERGIWIRAGGVGEGAEGVREGASDGGTRGALSSCVSWTVSLRKNLLLLCLECRWRRKVRWREPVQPGDSSLETAFVQGSGCMASWPHPAAE